MTMRTIVTTIDLGDFNWLDGTTGGFHRGGADAHYKLGVESVGRGGFMPYLTTLTLVAGLLMVWAGLCAI
jgi:hypothetical protein